MPLIDAGDDHEGDEQPRPACRAASPLLHESDHLADQQRLRERGAGADQAEHDDDGEQHAVLGEVRQQLAELARGPSSGVRRNGLRRAGASVTVMVGFLVDGWRVRRARTSCARPASILPRQRAMSCQEASALRARRTATASMPVELAPQLRDRAQGDDRIVRSGVTGERVQRSDVHVVNRS